MATCVIAVVAVAPCQCFSPGGNQITSPGRISSIGPPQRCASPQPAVTTSVWPTVRGSEIDVLVAAVALDPKRDADEPARGGSRTSGRLAGQIHLDRAVTKSCVLD